MEGFDLRSLATVLAAMAFVAIAWWAFSPRRRKDFDEAANIPFADEEEQGENDVDDVETDKKHGGDKQ